MKLLIILVILLCLLFIWCLCRASTISDENLEINSKMTINQFENTNTNID